MSSGCTVPHMEASLVDRHLQGEIIIVFVVVITADMLLSLLLLLQFIIYTTYCSSYSRTFPFSDICSLCCIAHKTPPRPTSCSGRSWPTTPSPPPARTPRGWTAPSRPPRASSSTAEVLSQLQYAIIDCIGQVILFFL